MDMRMKWAKKQRKYFDYETQNQRRMKAFRITALIAIVAIVAFFWTDISGAVGSLADGNKGQTTVPVNSMEKKAEEPSRGIIIKEQWEMPAELKEISGLSYIDAGRFACVQDELGKIYIYNTETSAVEKEIPFAGAGDFEGLAIVNQTAWVVRADGRLFEVSNYNTSPAVQEHKTHLTAEQNVEGLCYDRDNNRLLVAIKDEEPGEPGYKGIYSFDLATKKMPAQPVYKIDLTDGRFIKADKKKKKGSNLKPSAIAIHPVTRDIYITDGPKSKLLVLDKKGKTRDYYQLDSKHFTQPEGITFNASGELFISNEGSKRPGNIIKVEINE